MTEAFASTVAGRRTPAAVREFPFPGLQTDLGRIAGFLVVDARGRLVGRVEGPTCEGSYGTPATFTLSYGFLWLRRRLVSAESIEQIDDGAKVIGLRVDRKALRAGRA